MYERATLSRAVLAIVLAAGAVSAQAISVTDSGDLKFDTDVAQVSFSLSQGATDLKIWTDSWQNGTNFDPVSALWQLTSGGGYKLIAQNDDNPYIAPGQTLFDTGFSMSYLASGQYLVTVGAYPNFAYGTALSQGFDFTLQNVPSQPLSTWCQPGTTACDPGSFWRLNISGIDGGSPPPITTIPEPAAPLLAALGLLPLARLVRRRRA